MRKKLKVHLEEIWGEEGNFPLRGQARPVHAVRCHDCGAFLLFDYYTFKPLAYVTERGWSTTGGEWHCPTCLRNGPVTSDKENDAIDDDVLEQVFSGRDED